MASIEDVLLMLLPPWGTKAKSVLCDGLQTTEWDDLPDVISGFMIVDNISDHFLTGDLGFLKPFEGPTVLHPKRVATIECSFSDKWLTNGMWIGFTGLKVVSKSSLTLRPQSESALWCIPEVEQGVAVTYLNLFSGAFAGWERATTWLQKRGYSQTFRSISVDFEPQVMQVWSLQTDSKIWERPIHYDFSTQDVSFGILTCVSDPTILNAWRSAYNGIFTCSPPCQSWSKGGKGSGLESMNGLGFIKAINTVGKARPIAVAVECSDLLPMHPHFSIVKACFAFIGYKLAFSTIIKLEDIAPMTRTRWIAVWHRADVLVDIPKVSVFHDPCKGSWNHEMYRFFQPEHVAQSVVVSAQLTQIYGSYRFLPNGMKGQCSNPDDPTAVLCARCVDERENLPTLCASYGSQHKLDLKHLLSKGIFAPLIRCKDSFTFADPFRCAALLGATPHFGTACPYNLDDAWANLGNSVSVPQALQAIVITLNAIGLCKLVIPDTILQCWNDRFRSDLTVIIEKNQAFWMYHVEQIHQLFDADSKPSDERTLLQPSENCIHCSVKSNQSFRNFLCTYGIQDPDNQGLKLCCDNSEIEWDAIIDSHHGKPIQMCFRGRFILTFVFDVVIPPTICWKPDEEINEHDLISAVHQAELSCKRCRIFVAGFSPLLCSLDFTCIVSIRSTIEIAFPKLPSPQQLSICQVDTPDEYSHEVWFLAFREHEKIRTIICIQPEANPIAEVTAPDVSVFLFGKQVIDPRCAVINKHQIDPEISLNDGDVIIIKPDCSLATTQTDLCVDAIHPIADADNQEPPHKKSRCAALFAGLNPLDPKCVRLSIALQKGISVGTDEFQFYAKTLDSSAQKATILQPFVFAQGTAIPNLSQYFGLLLERKTEVVCLPVIINNHWCAFEFRVRDLSIVTTLLNVRQTDRRESNSIVSKICSQSTRPLIFKNAVLPVIDGWCGWALINRWTKLCDSQAFDFLSPDLSPKLWDATNHNQEVSTGLIQLSYSARLAYIQQCDQHSFVQESIVFGAADVDDDMKGKDVDPWLKADPWQAKKNCRWEDLKLPADHPICDDKNVRLSQHHRHQLGSNLGGVAFVTKAMIPEVMTQQPKSPFALLLPASDKLVIDSSLKLNVSGPHEVIVEDSSSGAIYKRQVMLVQSGTGVSFKRDKPAYTAKLTEMSEIVLEIDIRLAHKDTISGFHEKPLEAFRTKVIDQFPAKITKNLNVYGFKHFKENLKKDQGEFFQAMCKIPTVDRKAFLERSGVGEICARDFVPKGGTVTDSTVIPRFWQCDKGGKEEAIRAASSLTGFGGLIITKRGIAVRAWVSQIGTIRGILMPHDERICELNRNIVPVVMRESTGWPSSISASEVVKATYHATSKAPVPTRCYKSLGLTTWSLGFAEAPEIKSFLAQFNEQTYEILITEPSDPSAIKAKNAKGKGKGKTQLTSQKPVNNNLQEPVDQVLTDRVACLEAKFGSLERRQDQLEHRITTGFDGVQDQLRQVLQAVVPRQSQPSTGMTPPPKVAKTS